MIVPLWHTGFYNTKMTVQPLFNEDRHTMHTQGANITQSPRNITETKNSLQGATFSCMGVNMPCVSLSTAAILHSRSAGRAAAVKVYTWVPIG